MLGDNRLKTNQNASTPPQSSAAMAENILTVSQLTFRIKDTLEYSFPAVWICGEISNLSRPGSGHIYFTLKDDHAQIRAVLWRTTAQQVRFDLEDGLEVVARGAIDVYPPRGSYQFIVGDIEPLGLGPLELAYRQLFERLSKEGLFDAKAKKTLPKFPRRIAIVTSPTGAAIRDFLEVIARRSRSANILIIPTRVQGEGAAAEIAEGIANANRLRPPPDLLVIGRGGGSMEDLWCFNEEVVVRAVFSSETPIISAVGHEIDVTLSDLAADRRAATPTEAAEFAAPSHEEAMRELAEASTRLTTSIKTVLQKRQARLEAIEARHPFRKPFDVLRERAHRIDELDLRLRRAIHVKLQRAKEKTPSAALQLHALSPLAVLSRGYTVTRLADSGEVIRSADVLSAGSEMITQFASGEVESVVIGRRKEG